MSIIDAILRNKNLIKRVNNLVGQTGSSNTEIVDARYSEKKDTTYPILKDRIDDIDDEIGVLSGNTNSRSVNVKFPPAPLNAAKGDGITDDTVAVQAIINYCQTNKFAIEFPIGKYIISEQLTATSIIKFKGVLSTSFHYTESPFLYGSVIVDARENVGVDDFLIVTTRGNSGSLSFENLTFHGKNENKSCINFKQSGWTLNIHNINIDGFNGHAIKFQTTFDTNIINLTITRCGRAIVDNVPYYALVFDKLVNDDRTNAHHFVNLHMEFCRYYIDFVTCRHILFSNTKIEVLNETVSPYNNTITGITDDNVNPYIRYGVSQTYEILFSDSFFVFRGIEEWINKYPSLSPSDIPYCIQATGDTSSVYGHMKFNDCFFTCPSNYGGMKLFDTGNTEFDFESTGCTFQYLSLLDSAMILNNSSFSDCKLYFHVSQGVAANPIVATKSVFDNTHFLCSSTVASLLTNVDNFQPITGDNLSTFKNIYTDNFKLMPVNYITYDNSISALSGTEASVDINTMAYAGNYLFDALISIPSGGATTGRIIVSILKNTTFIASQALNYTSNSISISLYGMTNIKKGDVIKVKVFQESGATKTVTIRTKVNRI